MVCMLLTLTFSCQACLLRAQETCETEVFRFSNKETLNSLSMLCWTWRGSYKGPWPISPYRELTVSLTCILAMSSFLYFCSVFFSRLARLSLYQLSRPK